MSSVLAVIPALRSPDRLLRPLRGHPLVAWSVAAARESRRVSRVACLCEDPSLGEAARRLGVEVVPAGRTRDPDHRESDLSAILAFIEKQGGDAEVVVLLRPEFAVWFPGQIDDAIDRLLSDPGATGVRAVVRGADRPTAAWRLGPGDPSYLRAANEPVMWDAGLFEAARRGSIGLDSFTGTRTLPWVVDAYQAIQAIDDTGRLIVAGLIDHDRTIKPGAPLPWDRIKLLVLDVDGTLTPGTMYYGPEGESLKRFHTHDGQGIKAVAAKGVRVAIITGEATSFTTARATKLGITEIALGIADKGPVFRDLCRRLGVAADEVAYVGDDIGDLPPLIEVAGAGGIACAVADARPEVRAAANYHCPSRGGHGAVRDVCDQIVAALNSRSPSLGA